MRESLIGWTYYWDNECLWSYDEKICALSKINIETMDAECAVSPMRILRNKGFEVGNLIGLDDMILVLPRNIGDEWIVYNKKSKKVEYGVFCREQYQSIAAVLVEDELIVLPVSLYHPVLIINLRKREVVRMIRLEGNGFIPDSNMVIWDVTKEQDEICFFITNSHFYGRIKDKKVQLIPLQIEKGRTLTCAVFCQSEMWTVDHKGEILYQFDGKGNLLEEYPIHIGAECGRLIAENNKVFLLPVNQQTIRVFDVETKQVREIDIQRDKKAFFIAETFHSVGYWGYIKRDSEIWFLPWRYSLQIVNMSSLSGIGGAFRYADDFSETDYPQYYKYASKFKRQVYSENKSNRRMEDYLILVENKEFTINKQSKSDIGKNIWNMFRQMI